MQYDPSHRGYEHRMMYANDEFRHSAPPERAAYFAAKAAQATSRTSTPAARSFAERDRKDRERLARHQEAHRVTTQMIAAWDGRRTA